MRVAGASLQEIADNLDYLSAPALGQELERRFRYEHRLFTDEQRSGLIALEVARLDALQQALWYDAIYLSDTRATDSILKIIALRCKLLGLDMMDPRQAASTVLVISGDEQKYIESLKRIEEDPSHQIEAN
jgi:hypothetical protein